MPDAATYAIRPDAVGRSATSVARSAAASWFDWDYFIERIDGA